MKITTTDATALKDSIELSNNGYLFAPSNFEQLVARSFPDMFIIRFDLGMLHPKISLK